MSAHGEYECTVVVTQHKLLKFEIDGVYPATGSIVRCSKFVFWHPTANTCKACWPCTIPARATSALEAPVDGFERLHYSAVLFGFLYCWAQAKKQGNAKLASQFETAAKQCKTRFVLLPNEDEAKRRKRSLDEEKDSLRDNASSMIGYKRTIGVIDVTQSLKNRSLDHDAQAIADWFNTVSFNSEEDKITKQVVLSHMKVAHEGSQATRAVHHNSTRRRRDTLRP